MNIYKPSQRIYQRQSVQHSCSRQSFKFVREAEYRVHEATTHGHAGSAGRWSIAESFRELLTSSIILRLRQARRYSYIYIYMVCAEWRRSVSEPNRDRVGLITGARKRPGDRLMKRLVQAGSRALRRAMLKWRAEACTVRSGSFTARRAHSCRPGPTRAPPERSCEPLREER